LNKAIAIDTKKNIGATTTDMGQIITQILGRFQKIFKRAQFFTVNTAAGIPNK